MLGTMGLTVLVLHKARMEAKVEGLVRRGAKPEMIRAARCSAIKATAAIVVKEDSEYQKLGLPGVLEII